jgi:beta-lactamase class A
MLADIDALVFDIQDIGARFYTYPWTMALALKAAAENKKRFVVLDRPNPIGGLQVQGNVNDTLTFVGLYPVPMRHGMTVGELATMINKDFGVGADLVVIKAENWTRDRYYDQTAMPWTPPSPNMPSIESATHYPGLCLFEGTNFSTGRGTPEAYRQVGAPYLNSPELIRRLETYRFPGVRFEPTTFTPSKPADKKYDGTLVNGVKFFVTDRTAYDPTQVAIAAIIEARRLHPTEFQITRGFDRLVGNALVRKQIESGASYQDVVRSWDTQIARFNRMRERSLLYPAPVGARSELPALEQTLRTRLAQLDSGEVGVSVIDLKSNKELHINGNVPMHAASTMKVPVLLELYRRGDLDRQIQVVNSFKSIADTSHYTLDAGDDSDSSVYKLIGQSATLRHLARRMIVRSSNLSTNLLIDVLTPEAVRKTTMEVGGTGMNVLRGVEDGPAFRKGLNNKTSAYGLAKVLEAIARCKIATRDACNEMLEVLSGQEFNEMIPAGVPAGTRVAHKTGWITGIKHDGAIVFRDDKPAYVLVVLTRGISEDDANRVGADVSRIVWNGLDKSVSSRAAMEL